MENNAPPTIIYILSWSYSDRSDSGIINCYRKKDTADSELDLLENHGDTHKIFTVTPISIDER